MAILDPKSMAILDPKSLAIQRSGRWNGTWAEARRQEDGAVAGIGVANRMGMGQGQDWGGG